VALVLYGAWAALIWFHETLTWWIVAPAGAYLVAWNFSLQHEAIRSIARRILRGYAEVAARWLVRPIFAPPRPRW